MVQVLGCGQLLATPFMPESPRWSVSKGESEQAARALRVLRAADADRVCDELRELTAELQPSSGGAEASAVGSGGGQSGGVGALAAMKTLFGDRSLRLPLTIALAMSVGQQWSGINAVFFYSTSFFASAGLSNPVVGTLLASTVNVIAMCAVVPLMERLGRKRLLLLGTRGMLGSALCLTAVLVAKAAGLAFPVLSLLSVLTVLAFVTAFEFGPGPIAWQVGETGMPCAMRFNRNLHHHLRHHLFHHPVLPSRGRSAPRYSQRRRERRPCPSLPRLTGCATR